MYNFCKWKTSSTDLIRLRFNFFGKNIIGHDTLRIVLYLETQCLIVLFLMILKLIAEFRCWKLDLV